MRGLCMAPPELRRCSGLDQAYTEAYTKGLHSKVKALLSLECSHHVVLVQQLCLAALRPPSVGGLGRTAHE